MTTPEEVIRVWQQRGDNRPTFADIDALAYAALQVLERAEKAESVERSHYRTIVGLRARIQELEAALREILEYDLEHHEQYAWSLGDVTHIARQALAENDAEAKS
jgi:hypothetical protein